MVSSALQPIAPVPVPRRRTERVLKVTPLYVTRELGDAIVAELHKLAIGRGGEELEQRMRVAYRSNPQAALQYDPAAVNEDEFVKRHINDPQVQAVAQIPSYERYTFLSPTNNVQFESADFRIQDPPSDVHTIIARADGPNGRFVQINVQSKFKDLNEVRNWQLNQIVIHGEDPNWVNAVHERFRGLTEPQKFKIRSLVYGNSLKLFWSSVVLLLFAEYRLTRWLYPTFDLKSPLSGTGALVMFGVLLGSLIVFAEVSIAAFSYWFPFFEIQENLSRSRTASQKFVTGAFSTIYFAAVLNFLVFLFGPVLGRLIGHP